LLDSATPRSAQPARVRLSPESQNDDLHLEPRDSDHADAQRVYRQQPGGKAQIFRAEETFYGARAANRNADGGDHRR
jgi:hypothetical protein